MTEAIIIFKPFDATLSRKGFDCGSGALNTWFREQAGQQEKRDSVRTHLGLATFDSRIASFFSLVAHEVELRDAARSRDFTRRRYPIPSVLIAKLAVDMHYQGKGLGRLTLSHALSLLSHTSVAIGFELVLVDAIDVNAAKFYERFGFRPLVDGEERLYLTTADLRKTLGEG